MGHQVYTNDGLPGYVTCHAHDSPEEHRPPRCAIDEQGFALCVCGCRWADLDALGAFDMPRGNHREGCPWQE